MIAEPHKTKTIRNLNFLSFLDRTNVLENADFNTFNIKSDKVVFDMTSQGTSAVSQEQYSGLFIGDETYAGSRNFEFLSQMVEKTYGQKHICPTHNIKGSHKLIAATMVKKDNVIYSNSLRPSDLLNDFCGAKVEVIRTNDKTHFTGNLDIKLLESKLAGSKNTPFIYIELYAGGIFPVSPDHIIALRALAEKNNTVLIVNMSYGVANAQFARENNDADKKKTIAEILKETGSAAHVIVLDAGQDPRSNTGGLIATNIYDLYDKYMNEVVVFEGLHTYGGMAGRTMEVFARGIDEMVKEEQAEWILQQNKLFAKLLAGIPLILGADGVYIKADEFLPNVKKYQAETLSAALYLTSGIRTFLKNRFASKTILPLQIPRLALTCDQITQIADAVKELYEQREKITGLILMNEPVWSDEAVYKWKRPILKDFQFSCEPYTIQHIEYVGVASREERLQYVKDAGYNTFLLQSKHVGIDLLTDSGTCSQTTQQWADYMNSSETQASPISYDDLEKEIRDVTGYKYVVVTHQGRAAEHIMSQCLIKKGFVPGNMYFTTTKLHQELAGGTFVDVIVDQAHIPTDQFRWKGNIDISKIDKIVKEHGADSIPYISFEFSVNLAGGQPVHMDNAKEVYEYCEKHNIPVMWDATRAIENAYMIKKYDERYKHVSIKDITRELFSYGHGCTVSAKKDYLVNIGGFLAIKDDEKFYKQAMHMLRIYEGSVKNGGLSSGDLAVFAQGLREMVDERYIMSRVEQTHYLGNKLLKAGVPIVEPIGSHAVFLDAKRFLPHIDQDEYPAQALASALFIESGVRAMERGNVSKGRDKDGKNYRPHLELVRLTLPRRVYSNAHMDFIADCIIELYKKRETIKGLRFVYEPPMLRFFQGKFEEVDKVQVV
ncbi:MAG: tryptophanase [Bacteroidota bacterium]